MSRLGFKDKFGNWKTIATNDELENYQEKQEGKSLSTNDYTNEDKSKVSTAESTTNKVTYISDHSTYVEYPSAKAVYNAISNFALVSETGNKITLSLDESTFELKAILKDKNDNTINTSNVIDLPIESMIISGRYDGNTKKIILTLRNGNVIEFSVSDLVSGLASENWVSTNYVAKVEGKGLSTNDYTTEEKTKLSGISEGAEANVQSDWNQTDNTADDFIKNKPTNVSDFTNDAGYLTQSDVKQTFDATSENPQSGKAVAEALTHIDVSNKEDKSNKVNVISSDSTDTQYPSAKAVYDAINSAIYDAMNTEY